MGYRTVGPTEMMSLGKSKRMAQSLGARFMMGRRVKTRPLGRSYSLSRRPVCVHEVPVRCSGTPEHALEEPDTRYLPITA